MTQTIKKEFELFSPKHGSIVIEGIEYRDLEEASRAITGLYGFKAGVEIFGRAFVLTADEIIRFAQTGLPYTLGGCNSKGVFTLRCHENGPTENVRWFDRGEAGNHEPDEESDSPFADRFFRFDRELTTFTLGGRPEAIFTKLTPLDLSGRDVCRMLDAADIRDHGGQWCVGFFTEPVALGRRVYPKGTVAVFQGRRPGKRFVVFSVAPGESSPDGE